MQALTRVNDSPKPDSGSAKAGDVARGPEYILWARSAWAIPAVILGVLALRLLYLALMCPYTLVEDEAHYWEWSRHLGLSYYTKGPGVAWTIHASTWLLGISEFGVRASSPIFGAITAFASAALATGVCGDRRAGLLAAACIMLSPIFHFGSILMTIDSPYCAFWAVAAWGLWKAVRRGWGPGLLIAGLGLGVAFLYKYTALLLLPGVLAYAMVYRKTLTKPSGLWLAAGVVGFVIAISPVLIWNQQQGWPTVKHLLGHIGAAGGDQPTSGREHYTPVWNLEFIGYQVGLIGPASLLALFAAGVSMGRARREPSYVHASGGHAERMFLVYAGLPVLIFYFGVSFATDGEGNWAMSAYPTLLALAGIGAVEGMDEMLARRRVWRALPVPRPKWGTLRRSPENARQVAWHATLAVGLVICPAMLRIDLLARLPLIGGSVPIGRLTQADVMGRDAGEKLEALGPGAMAIAQHYGRASQLAFYMPGRPEVLCASRFMGGRRTQYDYWPETSLERPELRGRPALLIGASADEWRAAFERVEELGTLEGDRKRGRPAFAGFGYLGFRSGGFGSEPAR